MALGARAQALLQSSAFNYVVSYLAESYANAILTSTAGDTTAREQNYLHHRALQDITSQLSAFVAAGEEVAARNQENDE